MKKKYKALMLDLDGTTIPNRRDGMPSKKVKDAVKKAQGVAFVCIVTGRPLSQAAPVLDALQITDPVVLLNGSQIINGKSRDFIYKKPLLLKDVIELLPKLEAYHSNLVIDEEFDAIQYFPEYKPKEVFNLFLRSLSEEMADKILDITSSFETVSTHKIISWTPGKFGLNISHVEATKQHAIFEVAKKLNIETHEIIGVGEGYNDFPLLMACGLKIAMGNAVPELKAIADYIAPGVEEDGVAAIIEKFIL
jgi:HAD superfamily hydrolase (TIGR01484 family)